LNKRYSFFNDSNAKSSCTKFPSQDNFLTLKREKFKIRPELNLKKERRYLEKHQLIQTNLENSN